MSNYDLISREALKKALEEDMKHGGVKTDEFDKGYDLGVKAAIEMLDNAPTATKDNRPNICFNCEHCCALTVNSDGEVKVMCNLGAENCDNQRPHGKWHALNFHTCYCTNCHFVFDIMKCDFMEKMKYCPNCGADMRGDNDVIK